MRNHTTHPKGDRHPMQAAVGTPSVQLVADRGVHEGETQGPQSHFRFFDTIVPASQENDNVVTEDTCRPADEVAHERRKEDQPGRRGRPVVRWLRHDFRDGVERHDTRRTAEGKNDTGDDDVGEREQQERSAEVLPVARPVLGEIDPRLQLLQVGPFGELRRQCIVDFWLARAFGPCQGVLDVFGIGHGRNRLSGPSHTAVDATEQKPREQGLLECEEEEDQDTRIDTGHYIL